MKLKRNFYYGLCLSLLLGLSTNINSLFGMNGPDLFLSAEADEMLISGTVTDSEGDPLIGVSVYVEETSTGTFTDVDGKYELRVQDDAQVLVFSFTGFKTQKIQIASRSVIDVVLEAGADLDEVVVTAIGISREKKALSYSISEVGSEDITTVQDHNPVNSLVGRVSGVTISQGTGGPGAGARVIIRGNNSITSNNQPLIVLDGMPLDDTGSNSGGSVYNSSVDGGALTNINPDDIESISVLKGPNAAALYGSRASNGVLLITTKKGTARKGIGVSINSNITFDSPMLLPDYQNDYGQGTAENIPGTVGDLKQSSGSWGPKIDGSSQLYFTGENRPYSAQPDNVSNFFRTAGKYVNTLALEGGSEMFNARFSYTNNQTESIIPNSGLQSHNFTLRSLMKLNEKLSLDAKATYYTRELTNSVSQGSEGVLSYVYFMPRNVDIADLETFQNPEVSLDAVSYGSLGANPYWILNHDSRESQRDRFFSFAKLEYQFTDWLSAFARVGTDLANRDYQTINQPGHHFYKGGRLFAGSSKNQETNSDFLIMINKDVSPLVDISVNLGGSSSYRTNEGVSFSSSNFKIPTRPILANTVINNPAYTPLTEKLVNSLYGSASIAYDGWAYLDITGRNDWSSALPEQNRSYFYPSVGASVLLSRFIDPGSKYFDLIKIRGNYAQVGNDTRPYQLHTLYYVAQDGYLGRTTLTRDNVRKSDDLKPETISSLEFGIETRFLNNRAFLDLSWYDISSKDLIYDVPVPAATGFSYFRENIGEITNTGIEFLLGGTPVRSNDFSWDIAVNFSKNENKLIDLIEDLESHTLNSTNSGNASIRATVDGGFGDIWGTTWRTNDQGQIIVNTDGVPLASTESVLLGNAQPDWIGGVTNSITYKSVNLRFLIDARIGGQVYSSTNASLDGSGVSVASLEHRENGIVVDGVIEEDDGSFTTNTTSISAQDYWGAYSGIASNYVIDQDNIRLRELVLSYAIPAASLANSPIKGLNVSLVGRNLLFLSKTIDHVDPEAILGTNNNGQGLIINNLPTTRSVGINLSLSF